ncbi:MAG TPA: protease pro-enzyme activation domain-containing protein, partial [Rhodanobacter sp.]|nr:protease pro-enzyme activation domain-containing protein [Rhodanobacter sp.]
TTPVMLLAQPASGSSTPAAISRPEAPRVVQAVSNTNLVTIPRTHLAFVAQATSSTPLADSARMSHLQLVLKPSALRQAQMEALIANQHNPKSALFQHWLTPQQFGDAFGVTDGDIAAVTAWLTAQGFTVNNVYPNKTQIDFSGTAGQVRQAFHTQENIYTINQVKHLANASDISIPAALKPVVAGVMGLNDFNPKALIEKPEMVQWNPSKKGFEPVSGSSASSQASSQKPVGQAVSFAGRRALMPNDLATMYGVRAIRNNGVTGTGITIAVVEDGDMNPGDWDNLRQVFNLAKYGGTFSQINPAPPSGPTNCNDPAITMYGESYETISDAEWATAIAPGANIVAASCTGYEADGSTPATDNFFGGVYLASLNLINSDTRPDIISASYGYGELGTDSASMTAINQMWAQADAEGISVFVATGDSGPNADFNGGVIEGAGIDVNVFATSPHVTAVGGTDLADILDGTTSRYFAPTPSVVGGTALSYVPEIPWNESCGNGVAAKSMGYYSAVTFCQQYLHYDPYGAYLKSEGGGGGPSIVDAKPTWQKQVFNAAQDQSRDIPDVALFAGSYGKFTSMMICTQYWPCTVSNVNPSVVILESGTSLSTPMFAGIQALMDQGLAARGLPADQGNAAPTLYALAAQEYGGPTGPMPATLATCNADNGATGTADCVFHNVTRGSISTSCMEPTEASPSNPVLVHTPNCYYYGYMPNAEANLGLTTTDAAPTAYGPGNKAYGAQPGWSFAAGLGSVNATNLLIAWRAFNHAPPAAAH